MNMDDENKEDGIYIGDTSAGIEGINGANGINVADVRNTSNIEEQKKGVVLETKPKRNIWKIMTIVIAVLLIASIIGNIYFFTLVGNSYNLGVETGAVCMITTYLNLQKNITSAASFQSVMQEQFQNCVNTYQQGKALNNTLVD